MTNKLIKAKQEDTGELEPLDNADLAMVMGNHMNVSDLLWRTKEEGLIRLGDMADSHLRNCALMLMGMGYQTYRGPDWLKINWLTAMRIEWEKRIRCGRKMWRMR